MPAQKNTFHNQQVPVQISLQFIHNKVQPYATCDKTENSAENDARTKKWQPRCEWIACDVVHLRAELLHHRRSFFQHRTRQLQHQRHHTIARIFTMHTQCTAVCLVISPFLNTARLIANECWSWDSRRQTPSSAVAYRLLLPLHLRWHKHLFIFPVQKHSCLSAAMHSGNRNWESYTGCRIQIHIRWLYIHVQNSSHFHTKLIQPIFFIPADVCTTPWIKAFLYCFSQPPELVFITQYLMSGTQFFEPFSSSSLCMIVFKFRIKTHPLTQPVNSTVNINSHSLSSHHLWSYNPQYIHTYYHYHNYFYYYY